MLAAIIEEENGNKSYFYIDKENKCFDGFKIKEQSIGKLAQSDLELFKCFLLGNNHKQMGQKDGYDVILDLDSGLYHFLKNGVEDLERLYTFNGENATQFLSLEEMNKLARRFKIGMFTIYFIGNALFLSLIGAMYTNSTRQYFDYNGVDNSASITFSIFSDSATYMFEDEVLKYKAGIRAEDIKEAIFSSCYLDEKEKNFLWNEELVNDLLPYYKDTFYDFIVRIRHKNMRIVDFTKEDEENFVDTIAGYYSMDNLLHVRGYQSSADLEKNKDKAGHEHVHSLQVNYDLSVVLEAVAEIINQEYYLNNGQNKKVSYPERCKYTKILMEIIGTEAVKDRIFREKSTAIEDAVRPYFSEEEFVEFMDLLKTPVPSRKKDDSIVEDWPRLEALLKVLYRNKFNAEIEENEIIQAILSGTLYNRVYFRKSLMLSEPSWYIPNYREMDITDAYNQGLVNFKQLVFIDIEDYANFDNPTATYKNLYVRDDTMEIVDESGLVFSDVDVNGDIKLKSRTGEIRTMDVKEAHQNGYVHIYGTAWINATLDDYLTHHDGDMTIVVDPAVGFLYSGDMKIVPDPYSIPTENKVYVDNVQDSQLQASSRK